MAISLYDFCVFTPLRLKSSWLGIVRSNTLLERDITTPPTALTAKTY